MGFVDILLLGIGLSMDAFAVSVCKGLAVRRADVKTALVCGAWFGFFQMLMPLIGYYLGRMFAEAIQAVDHWVAFGLLVLVGGNMIKESLDKSEETATPDLSFKAMLPLAVGISLAMAAEVSIWASVSLIGVTTFILSAVGVTIGGVFGNKFEKKAEFLGGAVLILLGCKILLESLGIL